MSALEHSARVAHARKVLAEFRDAVDDETVPYDPAGWAGRLVAALEMTLAADRDGDFVLVSRTDLRMAVVGRCTKHQQDAACSRLRTQLEAS